MSKVSLFNEANEALKNAMSVKLLMNQHKTDPGGEYNLNFMVELLEHEIGELKSALRKKDRLGAIMECGDIGNFTMMVVHCLLDHNVLKGQSHESGRPEKR